LSVVTPANESISYFSESDYIVKANGIRSSNFICLFWNKRI